MKYANGKDGPLIKTSYFNGVKNYQWVPDNVEHVSEEDSNNLIPKFENPMNSYMSNSFKVLK